MPRVIAILFLVVISACSFGQEIKTMNDTLKSPIDTVKAPTDSLVTLKNGKVVSVKEYAARYNPRKALLYAAIVPGMGQIYNKKYWKVPLVWGGMTALVIQTGIFDQGYTKYRNQLFSYLADPVNYQPDFSEAQLRTLIDGYRRQRDFFIILTGIVYLLQMVDAHVDAHLKEFDLNPQLKLSVRPDTQQNNMIGRSNGFAITLIF
ncbi:hypothetical protein BH09BAC3_BH09BAC3_22790 [soil metagenome]